MAHGWFGRRRSSAPADSENGAPVVPEGLWTPCSRCKQLLFAREWERNLKVCMRCGHHARLTARERVDMLLDPGSFTEYDAGLLSADPLGFPDYTAKLEQHRQRSGMEDSILTGVGALNSAEIALAITDFHFMAGSMGCVVGERVTRIAERATARGLPLLLVSGTGGGVRQQEGLLGLMQMAKTAAALARHHDSGLLTIVLLTDPSLAGVMASWGSLGDLILAEPGALIGFAGERVAKQAQVGRAPTDFQTAEYQLGRGQIDRVVPRKELKATVSLALQFAGASGAGGSP